MNKTRMILFALNSCSRSMLHLLERVRTREVTEIDTPRNLQTMNALVDRGLINTEFLGCTKKDVDRFTVALDDTIANALTGHREHYRDKWMVE